MRPVLVALLAALLAVAAAAQEEEADPAQALAQLEENYTSYERAQQRLADMLAQYARGQNSHYLIGDNRVRVVDGIADAKRELAAAEAAHEELFEAARRAGVPWSELDRYEELPAPPASPGPKIEDDPDDITVDSENVDDVGLEEAEDSDAMEEDSENVDAESDGESKNVDADDDGESEDSDDLRATSRDPD